MKTMRGLDTISTHVWFSFRFSLGIKTHARDEFSHFLLAIKLMNY